MSPDTLFNLLKEALAAGESLPNLNFRGIIKSFSAESDNKIIIELVYSIDDGIIQTIFPSRRKTNLKYDSNDTEGFFRYVVSKTYGESSVNYFKKESDNVFSIKK